MTTLIPPTPKQCTNCLKDFYAREGAKFCGSTCRKAHHRKMIKLGGGDYIA